MEEIDLYDINKLENKNSDMKSDILLENVE